MATSAVNIASNALVLIGDSPISALTDNRVANALYEQSYLSLLSIHRWRFATKKVQLARLAAAPENEFTYQFQLPADLVYLIRTSRDTDYDYEIYEDKLYSNSAIVSIDYIFRVDESALPAYFVKAAEFFMATQFAIPVTGNSRRFQEYMGLYEMQLKRAKYADSSQRPNDGFLDSPYTDTRY